MRYENLPIVRVRPAKLPEPGGALGQELAEAVAGDVRFDAGTRAIYSTDASNYRQVPIGVVAPRSAEDVEAAVEVCRRHGAPILGRGGGTSLAGQCCNTAVVFDFSRYLADVVDIDPEAKTARVQPGLILDSLRSAAKPHHLDYGPDPATHNHCTLGGMIGNNACGIHAVMSEFYGPGSRTAEHVEELEVVLYDGSRMRVGRTGEEDLRQILAAGGRRAEIYRRLRDLRDRYAPLIRERFPDIPRRVSGYDLTWLLPENGFHVARALVGTESTCALVTEARIRMIEAKPERALVVLGFPSVYDAGDRVPEIREFRPVGLEGIGDRLIQDNLAQGEHVEQAKKLPEGKGWLFVEFGGRTPEEAADQARAMIGALRRGPTPPSAELVTDPEEKAGLWELRESGLGATAFVPGQPDAWPGWEDSAVPPDRVGQYLRGLRALLERFGYHCALYGHFGQGCIHTRIDFDLRTSEGIETYRRFTDQAADLTLSLGGSLSGEHGDGQARGDLLEKMYGPELVEAFREFKSVFDPDWQMNPGKVVAPRPRTEDLRLRAFPPEPVDSVFSYPEDDGDFRHAAIRCVGVGRCRRLGGGTMCPSYMVTLEEMHSTRGRARILYEMLLGEELPERWKSDQVEEALDLCLSCKGCKGECPVSVDMATYKAEFLYHHYKGRIRPRQAYAFGLIHRWARLASYVPWLANLVTQTPGLRAVAKLAAGAARGRPIPRFARRTFKQRYRGRGPRLDRGAPRVLLWPDTFNDHFFPETLIGAVEVLEDAGYRADVPGPYLCCGRPLYDYGMLDLARHLWRRTLDALEDDVRADTPVVGIEPSCVACFRDELPNLFPNDPRAARLARQTYTLPEFLLERADYPFPHVDEKAVVQAHCQHKAIMGFDAEQEAMARIGLDFSLLDSGCCGLAGSFGYEGRKYDLSMAAGERHLFPAVREQPEHTLVLADGFSCREQIQHGTGRYAYNLAEVLSEAIAMRDEARRLLPPPAPGPRPLAAER